MDCVVIILSFLSLIIAFFSLTIAFWALYLSILKKGKVEVYLYYSDIKPTIQASTNNMPINFSYNLPFMIKNSGAKAVAISSISWRDRVINMPNVAMEINPWLSGASTAYIILEPYDQKMGNVMISFKVIKYEEIGKGFQIIKECKEISLEELHSQVEKGSIALRLTYKAYEGKKIREAETVYDLTDKVKITILKNN